MDDNFPYAFIVDVDNLNAIKILIETKRLPQLLAIQPTDDQYDESNSSTPSIRFKYIIIVNKTFMDTCAKLATFWHGRDDLSYKFDYTTKTFLIQRPNQIDESKSIYWFMNKFFEYYWLGGHMK